MDDGSFPLEKVDALDPSYEDTADLDVTADRKKLTDTGAREHRVDGDSTDQTALQEEVGEADRAKEQQHGEAPKHGVLGAITPV
jgi:hypothetical protein